MDFLKLRSGERQNSSAALCIYSALMNRNAPPAMKNLSCAASTVYNYGMMVSAGGSSVFSGNLNLPIHQYRKSIYQNKLYLYSCLLQFFFKLPRRLKVDGMNA